MVEPSMSAASGSTLATRSDQMFPTLARAELDRLRRFGEPHAYAAGERIAVMLDPPALTAQLHLLDGR